MLHAYVGTQLLHSVFKVEYEDGDACHASVLLHILDQLPTPCRSLKSSCHTGWMLIEPAIDTKTMTLHYGTHYGVTGQQHQCSTCQCHRPLQQEQSDR